MALSGTFYGTTANENIQPKIVWSATQSVSGNYSTVTASLYYTRTNNTGDITKGTWRGTITINGTTTNSGYNKISIAYGSNTLAQAVSIKVPHNADGTKKVTISATGHISGTTLSSTSISSTITLDTINRRATVKSAPNFTDEENPTITYNNPAGSATTTLQACISLDKTTDNITYRDISKTGSSYTFNLTEVERKVLRAAAKNANSITVYFYIKTIIGGITYYHSLAKNLTIVNANPTLAATVIDTDATTKALTGNSNALIKYYSDAYITTGAAAKKEATIAKYSIVCGNKSLTTNGGTIANVESGTFVISIEDSRGNKATQTVNKTLTNYVKLTCGISPSMPTTDGKMTLTISGNYYDGSFGAVDNTLTVQYRMKADEAAYGAWTAASFTKKGNTYTAEVSITGLNYQSQYGFQARAIDKLATVSSVEKIVKTTPVFDWSKEDFNFNVPVSFNAGFTSHNVLLWQGAYYMTANQTAPLATPVSEQTNGIVLVFSNYDPTNQVANDYDWHCYFVPKYLVDIKGGTGHCFNMMSQSFGDICSKYIYIGDTELTGHDNNTKAATNNGISYNNSKYVMRYIFGV